MPAEHHVTHVSFSPLGGAGAVAARLVAAQRKAGWQAELVTLVKTPFPRWAARHPCVAMAALADYYLVRKPSRAAFFSLFRRQHATRVARRLSACDGVLHLHWLPGLLDPARLLAGRTGRKPVVWSLHDFWPMTGGCHYANDCEEFSRNCQDCPQVRAPFRRGVAAALRRKCAGLEGWHDLRIVAPSQWARSQVEFSSAMRGLPVSVIPNPVDTSTFTPVDRMTLRTKWNLDPAAFTVGVGAADLADPRKRIAETLSLLNDWMRSREALPAVQVLVFGAGRPLPGLPSAFRFMGPSKSVSMLAEWYNMMDIYVSLSRYETFGNTLAEAAACGVPSICLAGSGMEDVVVPGRTGLHVNAPTDLPEALSDCTKWPSNRRQLGLAAREHAVRYFDEGVIAGQFIALYQQSFESSGPQLGPDRT